MHHHSSFSPGWVLLWNSSQVSPFFSKNSSSICSHSFLSLFFNHQVSSFSHLSPYNGHSFTTIIFGAFTGILLSFMCYTHLSIVSLISHRYHEVITGISDECALSTFKKEDSEDECNMFLWKTLVRIYQTTWCHKSRQQQFSHSAKTPKSLIT
jgi:hypothetical protein